MEALMARSPVRRRWLLVSVESTNFRTLLAFGTTFAGLGLVVLGVLAEKSEGMDPVFICSIGVVTITLGLWITSVVPEFYSSLLFLFMVSILDIAPADRAFSGFYSSALWLIFGGLVIGHAVISTGLGNWIIRKLIALSPPGYMGALVVTALTGLSLAFVVPTAVGRAILIVPIAVQFAKQLGFDRGSSGNTGLVLTAGMSTALPAFTILPSNVPNLVMTGSAESLFGISFSYANYLAINFPILGGFGLIVIVLLNWLYFHEEPKFSTESEAAGDISNVGIRMAVVLGATVLFWTTDSWHGISPAWIAMGAALLIASPFVGALDARNLTEDINYAPVFFVAGVIGFGAVVSDTGISTWAGGKLVHLLNTADLNSDASIFAALLTVGLLVAIGTTVPTAPAVMTPLADQISAATNWPIESVLLAQVPTWVIIPVPYMVPPLLLTLSMGRIPSDQAIRLLLTYFVVGLLFIYPAHFLWARWLGVFG